MIERAGTCSVISVVIVVFAAVVLHRVETAQHINARTKPSEPIPTKAVPTQPVEPVAQPAPAMRRLKRPDASLTTAKEGETFADVAHRVYGTGANLDAFWKVNRDQLPTREAEVRTGMILRTPEL